MRDLTKYEKLKPLIRDPKSNITYQSGNFLGSGGFARCYEFKNTTTGEIFAGKISKKMSNAWNREIILQEIQIHRSLSHQNIVSLHSYFEDESNVYMILELCCKHSLMEMHKRRKSLTVPEVRYFMRQLALVCKYLHDSKIIHRDLKLGNLFINDDMEIKVGDFGFATRIRYEGEMKKTRCGTPNYIAPEILTKRGYSYKVDIWSLGCIMYTLLVGSPPFETSSLKKTYGKIKKCEFYLPPGLDYSARRLIQKLLHPDPAMRPNAETILKDNFLTFGYIPARLPKTCLVFSSNMSLCEVQERMGNVPAIIFEKKVVEADAKIQIDTAKGKNDFKN